MDDFANIYTNQQVNIFSACGEKWLEISVEYSIMLSYSGQLNCEIFERERSECQSTTIDCKLKLLLGKPRPITKDTLALH